jgi:hypothetical protein
MYLFIGVLSIFGAVYECAAFSTTFSAAFSTTFSTAFSTAFIAF